MKKFNYFACLAVMVALIGCEQVASPINEQAAGEQIGNEQQAVREIAVAEEPEGLLVGGARRGIAYSAIVFDGAEDAAPDAVPVPLAAGAGTAEKASVLLELVSVEGYLRWTGTGKFLIVLTELTETDAGEKVTVKFEDDVYFSKGKAAVEWAALNDLFQAEAVPLADFDTEAYYTAPSALTGAKTAVAVKRDTIDAEENEPLGPEETRNAPVQAGTALFESADDTPEGVSFFFGGVSSSGSFSTPTLSMSYSYSSGASYSSGKMAAMTQMLSQQSSALWAYRSSTMLASTYNSNSSSALWAYRSSTMMASTFNSNSSMGFTNISTQLGESVTVQSRLPQITGPTAFINDGRWVKDSSGYWVERSTLQTGVSTGAAQSSSSSSTSTSFTGTTDFIDNTGRWVKDSLGFWVERDTATPPPSSPPGTSAGAGAIAAKPEDDILVYNEGSFYRLSDMVTVNPWAASRGPIPPAESRNTGFVLEDGMRFRYDAEQNGWLPIQEPQSVNELPIFSGSTMPPQTPANVINSILFNYMNLDVATQAGPWQYLTMPAPAGTALPSQAPRPGYLWSWSKPLSPNGVWNMVRYPPFQAPEGTFWALTEVDGSIAWRLFNPGQ